MWFIQIMEGSIARLGLACYKKVSKLDYSTLSKSVIILQTACCYTVTASKIGPYDYLGTGHKAQRL